MSDLRELGDISLPFALDKKKNYIYIKDADRGTKYYCPCCSKEVNTIAIDDGVDYKMPPHYRHYPHQSCTGESLSHWVYKMWLFDKDSPFYIYDGINKTSYIVKTIDIEKTFKTDYGDYRPDITITTTCGKTLFFELNFSNPKRSDDYFCKWSQLNNDVIEVDVKKLLKDSLNNKVPTFRLVYSEGVCFDEKYNKRDAFANASNALLARKFEIKRQDMLNYKTVWEKLDWFFNSIKLYKAMKSTMDDVLNSFSEVPFEEMELCFNIIKNISCIDNNDGFRDIINNNFENKISLYLFDISKKSTIPEIKCNVTVRSGCSLNVSLICENDKCILNLFNPSFLCFLENRKWYMGYNYYKHVILKIDLLVQSIYEYYKFIDDIKKEITWNKFPLLYDSLGYTMIDSNIITDFYNMSIDDIYSLNKYKIINEIRDDYIIKAHIMYSKILMQKAIEKKEKLMKIIEDSRRLNMKNVVRREQYKRKIDCQSKERTDQRTCKLISTFIYKKSGIKFNVYVVNDNIIFESDLFRFNFGEFSNWNRTEIKNNCNRIIFLIKQLDLKTVKYHDFNFYEYDTLTEIIKKSDLIKYSTAKVNKILIGNGVINEGKDSFETQYTWLKDDACDIKYNNYYGTTTILWNGFGLMWLEQNIKKFTEHYKKLKTAYNDVINYFSRYVKEYPMFKISDIAYSDAYVLQLGILEYPHYDSTIAVIDKDYFNFNIGNTYEGCVLDCNICECEEALKKFLVGYVSGEENSNIRFFRLEEVNVNA